MIQNGIVFDLDSTLIYPTVKFDKVFEDFFQVPYGNVVEKWLGTIYESPLAKGVDVISNTFPNICEVKGKAKDFGLKWAKVQKIYPSIPEFLSNLKSDAKYKLGLLTNGPSDWQREVIEFLDLGKYFDVIIVSGDEDIGIRKPNPGIFKIMAKKLALHPESLFMIGDTKEKDIIPALELGWGAVWVNPHVERSRNNASVKLKDLLSNSRLITNEPVHINWQEVQI